MSARRRTTNPLGCLFGAVVILLGTVAAFALFQVTQSSRTEKILPTQTVVVAVQLPTTTPLPVTPSVTETHIFSTQGQLSALLTEVPYGKTENWDVSLLGKNAGHLQGTKRLGEKGNFVLVGHIELKDGSEGAFAHIDQLRVGDSILVLQNDLGKPKLSTYFVTETQKVNSDDLSTIRDHGFEELTLLTCHDWNANLKIYKSRFVVHARPATQAAATQAAILPVKKTGTFVKLPK